MRLHALSFEGRICACHAHVFHGNQLGNPAGKHSFDRGTWPFAHENDGTTRMKDDFDLISQPNFQMFRCGLWGVTWPLKLRVDSIRFVLQLKHKE